MSTAILFSSNMPLHILKLEDMSTASLKCTWRQLEIICTCLQSSNICRQQHKIKISLYLPSVTQSRAFLPVVILLRGSIDQNIVTVHFIVHNQTVSTASGESEYLISEIIERLHISQHIRVQV